MYFEKYPEHVKTVPNVRFQEKKEYYMVIQFPSKRKSINVCIVPPCPVLMATFLSIV